MFKDKELSRKFSAKVAQAISEGFSIHIGNLNRTETGDGLEGAVDLEKNGVLRRVYLQTKHDYYSAPHNTVSLKVAECPLPANAYDTHPWTSDMTVTESETWAYIQVGTKERIYTTTEEEDEIWNKQINRRIARRMYPDKKGEAYKKVALKYLKKRMGFKTCKLGDIENVIHDDIGFRVEVRGKCVYIAARKEK